MRKPDEQIADASLHLLIFLRIKNPLHRVHLQRVQNRIRVGVLQGREQARNISQGRGIAEGRQARRQLKNYARICVIFTEKIRINVVQVEGDGAEIGGARIILLDALHHRFSMARPDVLKRKIWREVLA